MGKSSPHVFFVWKEIQAPAEPLGGEGARSPPPPSCPHHLAQPVETARTYPVPGVPASPCIAALPAIPPVCHLSIQAHEPGSETPAFESSRGGAGPSLPPLVSVHSGESLGAAAADGAGSAVKTPRGVPCGWKWSPFAGSYSLEGRSQRPTVWGWESQKVSLRSCDLCPTGAYGGTGRRAEGFPEPSTRRVSAMGSPLPFPKLPLLAPLSAKVKMQIQLHRMAGRLWEGPQYYTYVGDFLDLGYLFQVQRPPGSNPAPGFLCSRPTGRSLGEAGAAARCGGSQSTQGPASGSAPLSSSGFHFKVLL